MDDKEFISNANEIVGETQKQGASIRLLGAVAFNIHCPAFSYFQEKANRHFTDLDFAASFSQNDAIRRSFSKFGFVEDREVAVVYARSRLVYNHPQTGLHVDVFFEKLDFCHPIYWNGILKLDNPTIPLAELVLEKMQIVKINEKDIIDSIMLTREHPIGDNDNETINAGRISTLCANDWGLWRTVTMNLNKVIDISQEYSWLEESDRKVVISRIEELLDRIMAAPKSSKWNLRNKIGDRMKWYKEVDEISE
ncbi:MAG: hypothetical protein ABSA23_04270 [Anaerolineales bacterium]